MNIPQISYSSSVDAENTDNNLNDGEGYFTLDTTLGEVISDHAFGDFGHLLFPVDRHTSTTMTLAQLSSSSVYVWYSHISPDKTVEILNYLRDQSLRGNRIFYPIYTDEEIKVDSSKAYTGLFFFRGAAGEPFAITNAGGRFAYVGAMHDSFPHSMEISKAGLNSFALIYRPDDPYRDLARAITYIQISLPLTISLA